MNNNNVSIYTIFICVLSALLLLVGVTSFAAGKSKRSGALEDLLQEDCVQLISDQWEVSNLGEGRWQVTGELDEAIHKVEYLSFYTAHNNVWVYIDETLVYDFTNEDNPFNIKTPGIEWHILRHAKGEEPARIKILVEEIYDSKPFRFEGMYRGSLFALISRIGSEIDVVLIGIILVTLGLTMLFTCIYLYMKGYGVKTNFWLGMLTVCIGLWIMLENRTIRIVGFSNLLECVVCLMAFYFFPVAMGRYINSACVLQCKKQIAWFTNVFLAFFITVTCFQVVGVYDYFEVLPFAHVLIGAGAAFLVISLGIEYIRHRSKEVAYFLVGVGVVVVAGELQLINYYTNWFEGYTSIFQLGFFLFCIILSKEGFANVTEAVYTQRRIRQLETLAFKDALTGLQNTAAYQRALVAYEKQRESKKCRIGIVVLDINDLKQINDCCGHEAGNTYIRCCVEVMKETFIYELIFRIGGDEFVVILPNITSSELAKIEKTFEVNIERFNKHHKMQVSIADGYELYQPNKHASLKAAFEAADHKMYEKKAAQKEMKKSQVSNTSV